VVQAEPRERKPTKADPAETQNSTIVEDDPLQDTKLKIKWAKTHIYQLNTIVEDFVNAVRIDLVRTPDAKIPENDCIVIHSSATVPDDVSLLAADIVHNLRVALDYLACRLAVANGKTMNGVHFPFGKTRNEFEASAREKIRKLAQPAREMIHALKPYRAGNDLLFSLHELDLANKHRMLTPSISFGYLKGGRFSVSDTVSVSLEPWGSLEKGVVLFSLSKSAKFEPDLKISFAITFENIETVKGQPIIAVLHQFANLVERIVSTVERATFATHPGCHHGSC